MNAEMMEMVIEARARMAKHVATSPPGEQGRADIPRVIEAAGPYFYFHVIPCRPLRSGEVWDLWERVPKLFLGAAMRHHDEGIEIIARCDKSRVSPSLRYDQRPWVQLRLDNFAVPATKSGQRWIGSPDVNHTFAITEAMNPRPPAGDFRERLQVARGLAETFAAGLERLQARNAPAATIEVQRDALERHRQTVADLEGRLAMEAARRLGDAPCDLW